MKRFLWIILSVILTAIILMVVYLRFVLPSFVLPTGIVRSSNITPDKETGIGNWTEEMFVNRFKAHADSLFIPVEVSDGFNTAMPWTMYAKMDEDDLKAIYAYLQSLEPQKKQVLRFSPKE